MVKKTGADYVQGGSKKTVCSMCSAMSKEASLELLTHTS